MAPLPGDPLRKVTLNLYEVDCAAAEQYYGRGWSEKLREMWHSHMQITLSHYRTRRTLGDIINE